ncbi:MAG: ribosome-associated translation inhibitor RaiA [Armatimonadetes bacterium]|nr:ribosome-associated translation inhibitor RaiA [Armatimonadota bacterium]
MQVTVKGKNVQVTEALREYADKKLQRLDRYFKNIKAAHVTQSVQRGLHIVEVTLEGDGVVLRGEEKTGDMYASIDQVVEKLESQVKRFKGKLIERSHQPRDEWPEGAIYESEEDEMPRIVRTKQFQLKPMPVEEAAMQMELLNHNFYVFLNSENEQVNVIYKRNDGNYALIVAEV